MDGFSYTTIIEPAEPLARRRGWIGRPLNYSMKLSQKLRFGVVLLMLGCTVGCGQTTKHIARSELGGQSFIKLPGGFGEFRFAQNPASFLSFGESLPQSLRLKIFTIGAGIGLFCLLAYLMLGSRFSWLCFAGLGLVWAGGMSNLIDRITRHGLVSDFIFLRIGLFHTGIFNVADVVIMLGITLLAYDLWWRRRKQETNQAAQS